MATRKKVKRKQTKKRAIRTPKPRKRGSPGPKAPRSRAAAVHPAPRKPKKAAKPVSKKPKNKKVLSEEHKERIRAGLRKWHKEHRTKKGANLRNKLIDVGKHKQKVKLPDEMPLQAFERISIVMEQMQDSIRSDAIREELGITHNLSTLLDYERRADGSIVFELMTMVPRGVSARDLLLTVQKVFPLIEGTWVSTVLRFTKEKAMSREEWKHYEKFHRFLQVGTHYQRGDRTAKVVDNLLGAINIENSMKRNRRHRVEQLLYRVFWQPGGERPK